MVHGKQDGEIHCYYHCLLNTKPSLGGSSGGGYGVHTANVGYHISSARLLCVSQMVSLRSWFM